MVQDTHISTLKTAADKSRQSLDSLSDLIGHAEQAAQSGKIDSDVLAKTQKQALLDSFAVKKFHREYKEWENAQKEQFILEQVKPYNQKYAHMSRVYTDYEALAAALEDVSKSIRIPAFSFSIQTIQKFDNGSLLDRVAKAENGKLPEKVLVEQLFSLDADSGLPAPSFAVFNRLVNLEFRLRLLMHIKYETLVKAKTDLQAKNRQWAARDTTLNMFFTRDFASVYENVKKIKTSEYEDLKFYDEYEDSESDEDEDIEDEDIEESEESEGDEGEGDEDDNRTPEGDMVVDDENEKEESENTPHPGDKTETDGNLEGPADEMDVEDRADGDAGHTATDILQSLESTEEPTEEPTEGSGTKPGENEVHAEENGREDMELD